MALFRANIDPALSIAEYVNLVKLGVAQNSQLWRDPDIFSTHLVEPLLRWSVEDPTWSDAAIGLLLDRVKEHNRLPNHRSDS